MKIFLTSLFLLLLVTVSFPTTSAARGACSSHGGVNCAAGADRDGSVICYDGWRGSSVSYSSMVMCMNEDIVDIPFTETTVTQVTDPTTQVHAFNTTARSALSNDIQILEESFIFENSLTQIQKDVTDVNSKTLSEEVDFESGISTLNEYLTTSYRFTTDIENQILEILKSNKEYVEEEYKKATSAIFFPTDYPGLAYSETLNGYDTLIQSIQEKANETKKRLSVVEENVNNLKLASTACKELEGKYSISRGCIISKEVATSSGSVLESSIVFTRSVPPFTDGILSLYPKAVDTLLQSKIVSGYPDNTFRPQNHINRAEFLKIVLGAKDIEPFGVSCFSDVGSEWFAGYVCKAKTLGIIEGYSDGTFKPSNNITVAEALKITLTTLKPYVAYTEKSNAQWFEKYTEYARANSLWLPSFKEEASLVSRDEMAELVYRIK